LRNMVVSFRQPGRKGFPPGSQTGYFRPVEPAL